MLECREDEYRSFEVSVHGYQKLLIQGLDHFPNRFICRGPGGLVSEFLVPPRIGDVGTTAACRGARRGENAPPPAARIPQTGPRVPPLNPRKQTPSLP